MKIGILGTGMVGKTLGTKLAQLGHEVKMGSREAGNKEGAAWAKSAGKGASEGTFTDAAKFGEMVFVCLRGDVALPVVQGVAKSVPAAQLKGKVFVDVSNPLDVSKPLPFPSLPELTNTTSLGEEVQKALPDSLVVKALNTVNCEVMVNPSLVHGDSDLFICGNDAGAKRKVTEVLHEFGWKDPIDLGDITNARGTESLMPIWMRLWGVFGTPHFNFKITK
jgi:8-hydroxy-5-deazaflavin:NADPH oxidoreductase